MKLGLYFLIEGKNGKLKIVDKVPRKVWDSILHCKSKLNLFKTKGKLKI